jgi:ubiquinone/menaquinone biosynthesis C-methylase UbiE
VSNGFLKPKEILNRLELRDDIIAADFGSGSGGWVLPLAKKLEEGKVYAIDILEEPLSALISQAKAQKIINIETQIQDVERGVAIGDESCDLVLMTNLLFQCDDKKKVLEEGKRVLKPGGRILVVDWEKDTPIGPKEGRVSVEEVKNVAQELGLKVGKEFPAGIYHYAIILVKPGSEILTRSTK